MKKGNGDLLVLLTGLILMAAGLCLLRCYEAAEGVLRVLPSRPRRWRTWK